MVEIMHDTVANAFSRYLSDLLEVIPVSFEHHENRVTLIFSDARGVYYVHITEVLGMYYEVRVITKRYGCKLPFFANVGAMFASKTYYKHIEDTLVSSKLKLEAFYSEASE